MAREYTAEELGLSSKQKEYTAEELGLPEGTREFTAAELGLEQEPSKDTGIMSMMGRGIVRGAKQTGSAIADVIPAMVASALGKDEYAKKQMEEAAQTQREIEKDYGARYKSLEDVKGVGDYIPFALETLAEQVPNMATALVPGVGGGALAARTVAGMAAKEAAKRVAVGQATGTYLGSYALNAPEIFQNIHDETGKMEPAAALLAGSVSAALDSVLPTTLLNKLTPGVKAGVVERLLEKSGMPSEIARKVIGGAITGVAAEGPTEAAQEAISIAAEKFVQDNPEVWGSKEFNRLIESGVRGAVGGAGFGAIGGAGETYVQRADSRKVDKEFRDTVVEDFEAKFEETKGRAPTKEETKVFVDAVEQAREEQKAEETASEDTGADTRAAESSISIPGEFDTGTTRATVDTEDVATRSMVGDNGLAGIPTDRETAEPSALDTKTFDELREIRNNYQAELNALLYKNGNKPKEGTKRREEYDGLHTRLIDISNRMDQKYKETEATKDVEVDPLRNYFDTKNKLNARYDEIQLTFDELTDKYWALEYKPDYAAVAERKEVWRLKNAIAKEQDSILTQLENLKLPPVPDAVKQELAGAPDAVKQEFATPQYSEADLAELKRRENVVQEETRLREVESSLKHFEPEGVAKGHFGPGRMSRSKIIMMPIDDFLGMAKNEPATKSKQENVDKLIADGTPFSSIPFLRLEDNVEPGVSKVVGHEGRHRARALKKIGVKEIPVEIRSDSIRWSEQDDPDNEDYEKSWPTQLISENSKYPTHDYPISREQGASRGNLIWSKESPSAKVAAEVAKPKKDKETAQGDVVTPPKPKKETKLKKQVDDFIDDFDDVPDRLSRDDLDNLLADSTAVKVPKTVFYHGTNKAFTRFKSSKRGSLGAGIYATPNPQAANIYAMEGVSGDRDLAGANVQPIYVDIKNPLVVNRKYAHDTAVQALIALGVNEDKASDIVEKANEKYGFVGNEIKSRAIKAGYDGIIVKNEDGTIGEIVVYDPDQITSAIQSLNTSPKANKVSVDDPLFKAAHPTVIRAISNNDITGVIKGLKDNAGTFISSFADRLLGLGLTTQIGWDDVHVELAMQSLAKVDGQKNRIIGWIKQIYPEVYRNKFDESKMQTPVTDLLQAFKDLRDGKLGIPPKMFAVDLEDVIKKYASTVVTLNSSGTYFTDYNAIGLSLENGGGSNYVVTHELAHAATHWAINNPSKLNDKQKDALGKLKALYEFAKLHTKDPSQYGYKNLHEFVAEAFSRPEFQKELRAMKAGMETDMSAWSKFIQLVARLFGYDNVLFHTLANADILFSARSGSEASGGSDMLWSPSRYDVKDGKFVLNPGERMGFINKLIKGRTNWKDVNKDSVKKFFGSLNNQYRRYLLGALTIDQMADIYGADMPQLKLYAKEVDAMIATRNAILTEGDPIITTWSNLLKDNPAKAKQLGQAMIEATIKKNDPDPKGIGHDAKAYATDASLKKAWTELTTGKDSDTAVKIYREVRDFYERRMDEYVKVQLKRIEEYGQIKGLTKEKIAAKQVAFKRDTEEKIIRPYFPIKRFGDYFLMVGKGQKKIFMQFEDAFARDAEMEKQKAKLISSGLSDADAQGMLWPGQGFNEVLNEKLNDVTQLSKINQMIDESTDAILKSKNPKVTANQIASLQAELKDQFGQYYLELLPSESIKKMFLHRDNVAGPSQDMLRAFGMSRERIAYQRARFQHMPELFNIVEAAKIRSKTMPTTHEKSVYGDVANELAKNFKGAVLEPPKQSRLTTYLTHFGFLNFLTAPASAVVNMMAIPAIYTPVAGAKYGYKNVSKALAKYTRMLGGTGYQNENNGRVEFLSLARAKLADVPLLDKAGKPVFRTDADGNRVPVNMADVYQYGVNRNVIDTTLTHDSVSIGEHPSSDYTGRWQKFMYYASLPFHAAEKFNREVTFMSSFDLAYDKLIAKGYTGEKAYAAALDAARDLTQETMFNYNTTNKPRYFRGDLINVLLQFKMYPQHMSVLLGRTFYKSINQNEEHELNLIRENLKTAPPEVLAKALEDKKAELAELKREATKAFWGMMGMSFLSAGATGLPLWFVFSGVMSAFHAAFGDDDEPFDVENWFKNWANRTFSGLLGDTVGGFLGDSISRGVLSQATGMNFADRMNMNLTDMWFPDVRKSQDEVDYVQNMFINLMGPSAGAILVNYPEALKRLNDGHIERAIEGMMPAAIKNAMVGTRYLVQGEALTLKGNTLVDDISAREALAQMLGFSPERVAQKQKAAIEAKNINETILNRKTDLLNAFFIATDSGDEDMLDRVIDKMATFSQTYPELAINGETLLKSVTKRYKDRALANITGGMGLDKKLIPRLEDMLDYGED